MTTLIYLQLKQNSNKNTNNSFVGGTRQASSQTYSENGENKVLNLLTEKHLWLLL